MPFSYAQYAGNGSATTFSVPFPYLLKAHVKLFYGYNLTSGAFTSELVDGVGFTWTSGTQVQTTVAPAVGQTLTIVRQTPSNALVVQWQDGSNLVAEDLQDSSLQNLYAVQEQDDVVSLSAAESATAATAAAAAVTTANAASTTANGIAGTANTALSNSSAAVTTANAASTTANGIAGTANTALSNSSAAVTTANAASATATAAQTTANAIAGTANTALSNSSAAVTTANAADATANGIAGTANTALSNSTAAQSTANSATTAAAAAQSTANSATSAAAAAQTTANSATTAAAAAQSTANAALPKAGGTMTGNLVVPSLNGGPLAGFRNRIINGNFDIWQRGTIFSVTTANTYTADRWAIFFDGTGATRTILRQSFTLGQTDVPNEPEYFVRFAQSVAGSGSTLNHIDQRIEDVRTLAGQQVTVSFWAKAAASTTMPSVVLQQYFGTGGSPSASVNTTAGSSLALTTSWQKFSYSVSLPSISGKTLGTDGIDSLVVLFSMPLNATFTVDIAQVQLEPGPVATPFERRPIGTELALCQRYFEKSYNLATVPGSNTGLAASIEDTSIGGSSPIRVRFATTKRATPSGRIYDAVGTIDTMTLFISAVQTNGQAATAVDNFGESGFKVFTPNTANVSRGSFHWTVSAEL